MRSVGKARHQIMGEHICCEKCMMCCAYAHTRRNYECGTCGKSNARRSGGAQRGGSRSVCALVRRRGEGAQGKFIAGWRNLEQSYFLCALKAVAATWACAPCLYLNHLPLRRVQAHTFVMTQFQPPKEVSPSFWCFACEAQISRCATLIRFLGEKFDRSVTFARFRIFPCSRPGSVGTLKCGENLFLAEIGVSVGLVLFAGKLI